MSDSNSEQNSRTELGGGAGDQPPPEGPVQRAARENPKLALVMSTVGALAVFITILIVVFNPQGTLLEQLSEASYARGLITFVFTIGTIGIAVLLVSNALSARGVDIAGRFDRGKEIFTALVGILGTILGFYFGQIQEAEAELDVTSPQVLEEVRASGAEVNLVASAFGGEPPYIYSLEFEPAIEPEEDGTWDNLVVSDSLIVQRIKLPTVDSTTTLAVKLRIRDTSGMRAESETRIPIVAAETPGEGAGGDQANNSQQDP